MPPHTMRAEEARTQPQLPALALSNIQGGQGKASPGDTCAKAGCAAFGVPSSNGAAAEDSLFLCYCGFPPLVLLWGGGSRSFLVEHLLGEQAQSGVLLPASLGVRAWVSLTAFPTLSRHLYSNPNEEKWYENDSDWAARPQGLPPQSSLAQQQRPGRSCQEPLWKRDPGFFLRLSKGS